MTIFEKIINKELPADLVYEDDLVIAVKDIAPQAPVHLLIIPKKAHPSLQQMPEEALDVLPHIAKVAQKLADEFGVAGGYRLITNIGESAGQTVFHLHFHLIGGKVLEHLV